MMHFPFTPFIWSLAQVTLICIIALVISWSLRGRAPQWTSAMLSGCSVAACVLTLIVWLPASHWSLTELATRLGSTDFDSSWTKNELKPLEGLDSSDSLSSDQQHTHSRPQRRQLVADSTTHRISQWIASTSSWLDMNLRRVDEGVRRFERSSTGSGRTVKRVQLLVIAALVMLAALWFYSWLWIRSIVRGSRPIEESLLQERLARLAATMQVKRLPVLIESRQVAIGATVGSRRARLILNPHWREWQEDELDAVLLHELAHMVRHDYVWVVITSWIRVLLFFHPLMHSLTRRLRMEQELAADQLAAGAMNNARAYGRALARLALRAESVAKVPGPVLTAEQVCIVRRVTMLKQGSLKPMKTRWHWSTAVMALTIACIAPLSGLRGTPPGPEQSAASEPTTEKVVKADEASDAQTETDENRKERIRQQWEERVLTNKQFPPINYVGRLKWQPDNLVADNSSRSLCYLQDLVSFALFESKLDNAEFHAPATVTLSWETERENVDS